MNPAAVEAVETMGANGASSSAESFMAIFTSLLLESRGSIWLFARIRVIENGVEVVDFNPGRTVALMREKSGVFFDQAELRARLVSEPWCILSGVKGTFKVSSGNGKLACWRIVPARMPEGVTKNKLIAFVSGWLSVRARRSGE